VVVGLDDTVFVDADRVVFVVAVLGRLDGAALVRVDDRPRGSPDGTALGREASAEGAALGREASGRAGTLRERAWSAVDSWRTSSRALGVGDCDLTTLRPSVL
jgi:hypothetical protein